MICCVHDEDQGALQDLCKLISPQETAFVLLASDRGVWHCIRYCMTVPRHSRLRLLSFWGAVALGGFWWVLPKSVRQSLSSVHSQRQPAQLHGSILSLIALNIATLARCPPQILADCPSWPVTFIMLDFQNCLYLSD